MEMLVTCDVATDTKEGRRRLRRVAKACQAYGQRVQKSVFECIVNAMEYEELKARLADEIDEAEDSLRFYRLREPRDRYLELMGKQPPHDLREPLVL